MRLSIERSRARHYAYYGERPPDEDWVEFGHDRSSREWAILPDLSPDDDVEARLGEAMAVYVKAANKEIGHGINEAVWRLVAYDGPAQVVQTTGGSVQIGKGPQETFELAGPTIQGRATMDDLHPEIVTQVKRRIERNAHPMLIGEPESLVSGPRPDPGTQIVVLDSWGDPVDEVTVSG